MGYLKLENNDGTFVKIEANTLANGYTSNQGNIDDLARFGFNEVDSNTQISSDLVSTNALTASHDIKINDTAVGASTSSSAAAKAVSINAISATTNVTASGNNLVTITVNNSQASSAASNISINGNAINFSSASSLSSTVTAINNAAIGDIVASANTDGNLQLVSSSGADIIIASSVAGTYFTGHTDTTGATISTASSVTFKGQIQLTHSSKDTIKISGDDVAEIGMQAQASTSSPSAGSTISVSSASNASMNVFGLDCVLIQVFIADDRSGAGRPLFRAYFGRASSVSDVSIGYSSSHASSIIDTSSGTAGPCQGLSMVTCTSARFT